MQIYTIHGVKFDKFGMKLWLVVDTKAKYLLNGFPYFGNKDTRANGQPLPENVVLKLFTEK